MAKRKNKFISSILKIALVLLIGYYFFNVNEDIQTKLYPKKYEETVSFYANKYNIDEYLVYSMIKVESSFDEDAKSSKGAKGLMQITDETANFIAKKAGIDDFEIEDLFIPEKNIMMGTWYFNYLRQKFDGDTKLAIIAYNAGPGSVNSWLKDEEFSRDGKTVVNIPYNETKNYAEKIIEVYDTYVELYKDT